MVLTIFYFTFGAKALDNWGMPSACLWGGMHTRRAHSQWGARPRGVLPSALQGCAGSVLSLS